MVMTRPDAHEEIEVNKTSDNHQTMATSSEMENPDDTDEFHHLIQEIKSHSSTQEEIPLGRNDPGKFKNYIPVRVNEQTCLAIVDSGNNWRTAISPMFAKRVGIDLERDLRPLKGITEIGTAKKSSTLRIL